MLNADGERARTILLRHATPHDLSITPDGVLNAMGAAFAMLNTNKGHTASVLHETPAEALTPYGIACKERGEARAALRDAEAGIRDRDGQLERLNAARRRDEGHPSPGQRRLGQGPR